jgi:hypothetical protein
MGLTLEDLAKLAGLADPAQVEVVFMNGDRATETATDQVLTVDSYVSDPDCGRLYLILTAKADA